MTEIEGHLFIVHGRIESVIHDAALVPVDQAYDFNSIWTPLVGERPPLPLKWKERGYGGIKPAPDRVWAVSIGNGLDRYEDVLDRIIGALRRIELRRDAYPPKRGPGRCRWWPFRSLASAAGGLEATGAQSFACWSRD